MVTDTMTTESTGTPVAAAPKPAPRSSTITLTGPNETALQLVAERKADDSARTYVITTDANKATARGMSESHATFEAAKAATEKMAKAAVKLGWKRKEARRGFVAKADAFTALPAPAPVAKAKK